MSSQTSDQSSPSPTEQQPPRKRWDVWRKTMFAGAFILLGNALAEALLEPDQPNAVKLLAQFAGFACLAAGFAMRMRDR